MQEAIPQNIDLHGNANDFTVKTQIVLTKNETVAIVTLKNVRDKSRSGWIITD